MGARVANSVTIGFARLVSLWRQLASRKPRSAPAEGSGENQVELHAAVRLSSGFGAASRPATPGDKARFSAKIRKITRSGIDLLVNTKLEPGNILDIELSSFAGRQASTVLAYVTHAVRQEADTWNVSCTFARELSEQDLERLGPPPKSPATDDKGQKTHSPSSLNGWYQIAAQGEQEKSPAQFFDLCANCVGLLVSNPVDVGTLLNLELIGVTEKVELEILACVVQLTPRDGQLWSLGCNFIRELTDTEMQKLLK
jgi:hypothetical protein